MLYLAIPLIQSKACISSSFTIQSPLTIPLPILACMFRNNQLYMTGGLCSAQGHLFHTDTLMLSVKTEYREGHIDNVQRC